MKQGDTAYSIAARFGVDAGIIIYDNQLVYPYDLAVGQALLINDSAFGNMQNIPVRTNGYAYPFISTWVLEQTLPYLTELSVFSYGFTPQGELIAPIADDEWMIVRARRAGTLPVLTLTPLGPDGRFSNVLISAVVRNREARSRLIENLLMVMSQKGYGGLDIDFEYILAEDRDAFTEFVRICADRMHEAGYRLSVALAPKTSADQPGLLYAGKDYRALGEEADSVLLMTYEWGYMYGPPMAVAPLQKVREVVQYAVTEIPPQKINLGIPNYGYDWPLPFEQGTTAADIIGNVEAVRIAAAYGAEIFYDEISQSPYFYYTDKGVSHVVWYEDVRSLSRKFGLIEEFGLQGAGYWNIMQFFRANWILLENRFAVK